MEYFAKGALAGLPPAGSVGLYVDSTGTFKTLDELGNVGSLAASIPAATPLAAGLMSAAQAAALAALTGGAVTVGMLYVGPEIDMTVVAQYVILPPQTGSIWNIGAYFFDYTQKDGTVTTGPTLNMGTNSSNNNLIPSAVVSAFSSQAVLTRINLTAVNPIPTGSAMDLSATGLRLNVTSGAVLGTATVCKAKMWFSYAVAPS